MEVGYNIGRLSGNVVTHMPTNSEVCGSNPGPNPNNGTCQPMSGS